MTRNSIRTSLIVVLFNRVEINKLAHKSQRTNEKLQEQITALETELATKESELIQERQVKEDLINQSFIAAQSQDSERSSLQTIV